MIAGDLSMGRRMTLSRWQMGRALLIGAGFALALAALFAFQSVEVPLTLTAGLVSSKTILAPARVTFASQIDTEDARAKAEAAIPDVYNPPSAALARGQVQRATRIFDHIDSVRHDPYSSPDQKLEWVRSIPNINLSTQTLSQTLTLDESTYHRLVTETLYVLELTMRDEIRPGDLPGEYARIPSRVSLALTSSQADLVSAWTRSFVVPNSLFDEKQTAALRAQARDRVGAVYRTIEKGEAVIREGQIVTPQAIEALEELGILRAPAVVEDYTGPALLSLLLTLMLTAFLIRLRPSLLAHSRVLLMMALMILAAAAGAKIAVTDTVVLVYLVPISAVVMLLSVLVDSVVALGATLVLAVAMGFFAHNSLEMTTYALIGGLVAALTLGRIERLPAFLWTGVYVALSNAAVVATFRLILHDGDASTFGPQMIAALGNGALAGLVAIGSLFVLGKLFGITTSLELMDLARPTHPLLRKLLNDAPGTYHHSLIVGELAEHAAQAIGADSLLVRVGAYYHDIGKTNEPYMFIENQMDGGNIHDRLPPQESASIVIGHISQGLSLARRHRLPLRLIEFIPQHHGTTLAAYFHRKAIHAHGGEEGVDDTTFRYPGPRPQFREAGILMLADGVEATTRAEHPGSPEEIRAIIDRIVGERLRDGQLDECDLTLRDLQTIKEAFFQVLQGLYHSRVKYPEAAPLALPAQTEPPETINAS